MSTKLDLRTTVIHKTKTTTLSECTSFTQSLHLYSSLLVWQPLWHASDRIEIKNLNHWKGKALGLMSRESFESHKKSKWLPYRLILIIIINKARLAEKTRIVSKKMTSKLSKRSIWVTLKAQFNPVVIKRITRLVRIKLGLRLWLPNKTMEPEDLRDLLPFQFR